MLAEHPFVIVNQDDIYEWEESIYPGILKELPYKLKSEDVLTALIPEDRTALLYRMLYEGIKEGGFHFKEWAGDHHFTKQDWPERALAIIKNAEEQYLIKSRANFYKASI